MVESGDSVQKGDTLATVDADSVKQAMLDVQEEIDELDEEIEETKDDSTSSYVTAKVSGTVTKIYAKKGKDVSKYMARKGALMIIQMDDENKTEVAVTAAVMISRELARRVDFLSLGTNDLSQYTLAMDRQNPLLRKKYNDHHPAVLRMIQMVIEAGHAENRRVCICGELAADTALTEEFLRMGVDCLSVVPACILPVRKALRQVDLSGDDRRNGCRQEDRKSVV